MNDIERLIQLEETLRLSILNNDVNTLETLLNPRLLFITPDGNVITKEMDLDAHKAKTMIADSIESNIEKIELFNNTAVVLVTYKTSGSMLGKPISGTLRYIRIWNKSDNNWQIIGGSCSFI
ncbi:MAG TPA: nuclear transport factor 2 family protein [Bacteroidia bacterium]